MNTGIFELLSEIVSQQAVDLINGLSCLIGDLCKSNPNEKGTPDPPARGARTGVVTYNAW